MQEVRVNNYLLLGPIYSIGLTINLGEFKDGYI